MVSPGPTVSGGGGRVSSVNGQTGHVVLAKADLGLGNVDNTSDVNKPVSTAVQAALDLKEALARKGAANGYAGLDGTGKVPTSQLPAALIGAVSYQGTWDATANSPALVSSTGTKGFYYKVAAAGATPIDGISDWKVGDWIIFNGATWDKVDNTDQVTSVAGRQGAVVLVKADVGLGNVDNTTDAGKPVSTAQQTALDAKTDKTTTVNGHALNGNVTVSKGDVGLGNVDNTTDTNKPVSTAHQAALDLKTDKATTVNGHALNGNVTVTKADVGLGNVDNTTDVGKPVSTAQQTALDAKEALANKGAVNGYAGLDGTGKVPTSQLPSIVITDTSVVSSQAAMLALVAETGDVCVRTDLSVSFILKGTDPTVLANWVQLLSPVSPVSSVAGRTGAVTLSASDISDATANGQALIKAANYAAMKTLLAVAVADITDASANGRSFIAAASYAAMKTLLSLVKGDVGLGNVDNTSDVNKPVSTAQQTALDLKAPLANPAFTGTTKLSQIIERATVSATAATGTVNFDFLTQAVLYYTSNASANWTLNVRGNAGNSLDSQMAVGDAATIAFIVPQGATPFYNSTFQIDGNAITPKWVGGAPTGGNASGLDVYEFSIIKTAAATFTILASLTQYK
jgi:hypothetical protein